MVEIRKYRSDDLEALSYELDDFQNQLTRLPTYSILERGDDSDPEKIPMTILFNDLPVGYFVLDFGKDKLTLTENKKSILIRSVSLNPLFQGKRIAKEAFHKISEFANENFPEYNELVLTVNFRNEKAHQLYLKTNFIDEGKTAENRNGPQHILSKKIK